MQRGLVSPSIPEFRARALEVYYTHHASVSSAMEAFDQLESYYEENYLEYYIQNSNLIQNAIMEVKTAYSNSVFPEQKSDWTSHADNIGHLNSPGCFRCHDGQHLTEDKEAIRLECNLCHSIPVVADEDAFLTEIELSTGPEPETHLNTNWISLHHLAFEPSCESCHTVDDPGGVSNLSFCANSACHGVSWEFAGFDAPALRETILDLLPPPQPTPTPIPTPAEEEQVTYDSIIAGILMGRCGICHGESAQAGLDLSSYESTLAGNENGPVVLSGDVENSLLLLKTAGADSHFAQFTNQEIELITEWIESGLPEN
jgi:mono/diheme cytochrome c family protein